MIWKSSRIGVLSLHVHVWVSRNGLEFCRVSKEVGGRRETVESVNLFKYTNNITCIHPKPCKQAEPHASVCLTSSYGRLRLEQSFAFRPATCCWATPAYSIASISTPQVAGESWLWPSFHLISPACTAFSSSNGLFWKHASIVSESSSTPSRTALPFPAAFRLTYVRKILRWSRRST